MEDQRVSRNTMSFALPEELRAYVDERVATGEYGNTSEYLRELIRRDRHEQVIDRLRTLVIEGLESGDPGPAHVIRIPREARIRVFEETSERASDAPSPSRVPDATPAAPLPSMERDRFADLRIIGPGLLRHGRQGENPGEEKGGCKKPGQLFHGVAVQ